MGPPLLETLLTQLRKLDPNPSPNSTSTSNPNSTSTSTSNPNSTSTSTFTSTSTSTFTSTSNPTSKEVRLESRETNPKEVRLQPREAPKETRPETKLEETPESRLASWRGGTPFQTVYLMTVIGSTFCVPFLPTDTMDFFLRVCHHLRVADSYEFLGRKLASSDTVAKAGIFANCVIHSKASF